MHPFFGMAYAATMMNAYAARTWMELLMYAWSPPAPHVLHNVVNLDERRRPWTG